MDVLVEFVDYYLNLDNCWLYKGVPRDELWRQALTIYMLVLCATAMLYMFFSTLDYVFLYDKRHLKDKRVHENQIQTEIRWAFYYMPMTDLMFLPFWLLEMRYAKLTRDFSAHTPLQHVGLAIAFFIFSEFGTYWGHRIEHHPLLYARIHKQHHYFKVVTPYSSLALSPIDAWLQGISPHLFVFLFPLNSYVYIVLFFLLQVWSVSIHDQFYVSRYSRLNPLINSAAHHTTHHLKFNYNYGLVTTIFDRLFGSFLEPSAEDCEHWLEKMYRRRRRTPGEEDWSKQGDSYGLPSSEDVDDEDVLEAMTSPTSVTDGGEYLVPEGKQVAWTDTGQPYLIKARDESEAGDDDGSESEEAMQEHVREQLGLCVAMDVIERKFGIGTRIYWHFLLYLIYTNLVLGMLVGTNYFFYLSTRLCDDEKGCGPFNTPALGAIHVTWCYERLSHYLIVPRSQDATAAVCAVGTLTFDGVQCAQTSSKPLLPPAIQPAVSRSSPFIDSSFKFNELFVGQYTDLHLGVWRATTIVASLLSLVLGLIFFCWVRLKMRAGHFKTKTAHSKDHDNPFSFSGLEAAMIPGSERVTAVARLLRILGSYTVFFSLLALSFGLVFWLERINKRDVETGSGPQLYGFRLIDMAITAVVTIINIFFTQISRALTKFEKHQKWADHRRHHTLKLYTFKILNVTAMYAAIGVIPIKSACPYNDTGRKFLLLMVTDLVLGNLIEVFVPLIKGQVFKRIKRLRHKGSDEAAKPEFDLAEEYLELFYRQFIVYLGMSLFSLLPLFAALVNVLEYFIDRMRFTQICQRPKRIDITMKYFLAVLLSVTSLLAIALPPVGTAWTLSGTAPFQSHPDACPLFNSFVIEQQPIAASCNSILSLACQCKEMETMNMTATATATTTTTAAAAAAGAGASSFEAAAQVDRLDRINRCISVFGVAANLTCSDLAQGEELF